MNLRGNNFVSQIFHISVVEATIKGLIGGDKYYFNVNVNGESRVYYIEVFDHNDGGESFRLYRDFTKYVGKPAHIPAYGYNHNEDELIKVFKSTQEQIVIGTQPSVDAEGNTVNKPIYADNKLVSYSETPANTMAQYTLVYIDALQTV